MERADHSSLGNLGLPTTQPCAASTFVGQPVTRKHSAGIGKKEITSLTCDLGNSQKAYSINSQVQITTD